jgi:hypothetical protein
MSGCPKVPIQFIDLEKPASAFAMIGMLPPSFTAFSSSSNEKLELLLPTV